MSALNRRQISTSAREQFVILIPFTEPALSIYAKDVAASFTSSSPYSFFFFLFNCGFYSLLAHYGSLSLATLTMPSLPPPYIPISPSPRYICAGHICAGHRQHNKSCLSRKAMGMTGFSQIPTGPRER